MAVSREFFFFFTILPTEILVDISFTLEQNVIARLDCISSTLWFGELRLADKFQFKIAANKFVRAKISTGSPS